MVIIFLEDNNISIFFFLGPKKKCIGPKGKARAKKKNVIHNGMLELNNLLHKTMENETAGNAIERCPETTFTRQG